MTSWSIGGKRFEVHDGVNRLQLGLHGVRSLQVSIADVWPNGDLELALTIRTLAVADGVLLLVASGLLRRQIQLFGFGQKTHIELPGEAPDP